MHASWNGPAKNFKASGLVSLDEVIHPGESELLEIEGAAVEVGVKALVKSGYTGDVTVNVWTISSEEGVGEGDTMKSVVSLVGSSD